GVARGARTARVDGAAPAAAHRRDRGRGCSQRPRTAHSGARADECGLRRLSPAASLVALAQLPALASTGGMPTTDPALTVTEREAPMHAWAIGATAIAAVVFGAGAAPKQRPEAAQKTQAPSAASMQVLTEIKGYASWPRFPEHATRRFSK